MIPISLKSALLWATVAVSTLVQRGEAFQGSSCLIPSHLALRMPMSSSATLRTASIRASGLSLSMTAIDRRSFLAAAGALFSAIDKNKDGSLDEKEIAAFAGGSGGGGDGAQKADEKLVKSLVSGLENLKGAVPYSDQTLAVFTDNSAMSAAAVEAAAKVGAKVVEIPASSSVEEAKDKYKTSECVAALISTEARLKEVMAGAGLECQRCGFFGDPAPPKWIVALNAPKGKSGEKIQEEAKLSGRDCDESGLCFQSGTPIPVYTPEELANPKVGKVRGGIDDDNNAR